MIRLNHLALVVADWERSREWYTRNLGLKVEFEVPARKTVALQDDGELTLFLSEQAHSAVATCTLAFEIDDVEAKHRELAARGVAFEKTPQKLFWGYGAELRDPDGHLIYLWDDQSMREKGG